MASEKTSKTVSIVFLLSAAAIFLWVGAAFIGGLKQANWQLGELARHYFVATGMTKPMHTLVDFYTHIKGIEYLICVAFFVAFPVFVKYINKEKKPVKVTAEV